MIEQPTTREPSAAVGLSRRAFQGSCLAGAILLLVNRDIDAGATARPDLAALDLQQAAERNTLCSGSNAKGVGLRGEYYDSTDWQGARIATRTDPVVDFDATLGLPQGGSPRPRSVRWSGWLMAPLSGDYQFHVDASDAQVVIARQALAGAGVPAGTTLHLDAGRFYPVSIGIARLGVAPGQRIRFEWTAPFGARYVVPRALLHLPTETATVAS